MNNWRLLLLAVVVVVQPIGSFTESNLIDGRECCERSEDARLYGYRKTDERRSLDGNREDRRTDWQRRLRTDGFRAERRYETTRGPMLTRSESLERSERRISPELSRSTEHRFIREQERRHRDTLARTRETREDQNRYHDESRNTLDQNERDSRGSRSRDTSDDTRTVRHSRDARDTRSVERDSRNTMSRSQIRAIRSNEERRYTQNRETILKREREVIVRFDIIRDSRLGAPTRSDSRIQLDNNREGRAFDRRTQEDGTEFGRSRLSDAGINEIRAQRTVQQNERHNRDSRDVRVELRRSQRDTELRDRINAVPRGSERTSADTIRDSREVNTRLVRDRMDTRTDQGTDERRQSRDASRNSILRNTEERRLDSKQIRASRTLDMTTRNDKRMERRSPSIDTLSKLRESHESRLSRSSGRNTRYERAARIRDVRDESSEERRQRDTNRISRDRIDPRQEARRTASRMDIRQPTEDNRQQRDVRNSIERRQEGRRTVSRRGVREFSEELRRKREVSNLSKDRTISAIRGDSDRTQESRRNIKESSEERRLQRESSRLSRDEISPLHEVRDVSERQSRDDARQSLGRRQRDSNISRYRITNSMIRKDHIIGDTERTQEARGVVSPSRTEMYFRKQDSRSRQDVKNNERSDLRRQVLERSIGRALMTRSMSAEQRDDARATSRASRSTEASRIREDTKGNERDERQQIREHGRIMGQRTRNVATPQRLDTLRSSRTESIRLEPIVRNRDLRQHGDQDRIERTIVLRVTPNVAQRLNTHRSSRTESIRLERLKRNNAEVRENERREMQREKRDSDRTSSLLNRRSSESMLAERRQDRESAKDSRKVRMTRNRSEVRVERVLAERRKENRNNIRDSRNIRDEVRSENVLAERRQNRNSRTVQREISKDDRLDTRRQRDSARDSRERSLQRESRDATERFTEWSRVTRSERARNNEREDRSDKSFRTDARESRNDIRVNNVLTMERVDRTYNRLAKDGKREETRFRNNDVVTFRNTLVQESDEPAFSNWQMVLYTLQGVYICGFLVQMLTENANKSKKRTFSWWSSPKNLIKVD